MACHPCYGVVHSCCSSGVADLDHRQQLGHNLMDRKHWTGETLLILIERRTSRGSWTEQESIEWSCSWFVGPKFVFIRFIVGSLLACDWTWSLCCGSFIDIVSDCNYVEKFPRERISLISFRNVVIYAKSFCNLKCNRAEQSGGCGTDMAKWVVGGWEEAALKYVPENEIRISSSIITIIITPK